MLQKTDINLTENERLSISSHSFGCYSYSPILFVLSFVLCLFLSFSFVSAEEMTNNVKQSLLSEVSTWSSYSSYSSYIDTYCSQYKNYAIITFNGSPNYQCLYFSNLDDLLIRLDDSGSWRLPLPNICIPFGSKIDNVNDWISFCNSDGYIIGLYNRDSEWILSQSRITVNPTGNKTLGTWIPSFYIPDSGFRYNFTKIAGSSTVNQKIPSTYPRSDLYSSSFNSLSVTNDYTTVSYSQTVIPQSYSEDNRLKLYTTQSASQGSLLHVDLSEFYQYNNGVSSNYSFSDVVLTLDCDGSEESFTLTPSGMQYEFLDSSTSSSRVYGYVVPYSFFSVSDYQNCSVVKVDFTRTISSPGGTGSELFKISCDYRLKSTNINGVSQDFAPVTLVPVPSVAVAPDQSTVQDWSDNTSYHSPAFGHNGSYVLLNSLPIFPDWVDKYTLDCTRVSKTVDGITLNLWIDLDNPYVSVNTALVDIPITAFFTPESYLKDNVLTDFYDVVVFKVWSDTGKTSVDGYLYFYTEKYDLKYQNNLFVQELSLEYDSLNLLSSGFSLIRSGLDNIDNNTAAYFTDSLFNDTIVISWLQTLNNTNAYGFTDVVNAIEGIPQYDDSSVISGIASVVSAIEGIDSPDLSDLESKLDTLINFFVADGSTENASSRTYRNWLRGVDDNTSRTVTYYADNVFSIVHDVFDLFDADGSVYYPPDSEDVVSTDYINFVKLFIEKMNSSTATNTGYNKYLRGFFQGGFDPHLIDGGL